LIRFWNRGSIEGENQERREREIWKSEEREREREKALGVFLFLSSFQEGGYIIPNYKNFRPRKFSLPKNRLGYDDRMCFSISQVKRSYFK